VFPPESLRDAIDHRLESETLTAEFPERGFAVLAAAVAATEGVPSVRLATLRGGQVIRSADAPVSPELLRRARRLRKELAAFGRALAAACREGAGPARR
jgi:hypothetical protein